ncbi:MAG: hypothetical protein ABSH38_20340 [Verrucomicrobiota bacterium]
MVPGVSRRGEPGIRLRDGLEKTYGWIYDQMAQQGKDKGAAGRG